MRDLPHCILFDCDGTIVDSQHLIVAAMSAAFRAHGLAIPARGDILSVVGLSLPETFAVLSRGARDFPVAALAEGYKAAFNQLRESEPTEPMFAGMRPLLADLAADPAVSLGIVTGKSQRGVRRLLDHYDMQSWFGAIQTADDAPSKPHPAMVQQAMRALGAVPDFTVVVGDTTYDMEMAKAAGARAIGVCWGYHDPADLLASGADLLVRDCDELRRALGGMLDTDRGAYERSA